MVAWRLNKSVVRGEIDNRERGKVRGRIWLFGHEQPIELRLQGDCLRDLAGARMVFTNPSPQPGEPVNLADMQEGRVGDMTASRKVRRIPEADIEKLVHEHDPARVSAYPLANCLYLEWYSRANGRVVIESYDYSLTVEERLWELTPEESRHRSTENMRAIAEWMEDLTDSLEDDEDGDDFDYLDEEPMDEFEWERFMRESDASSEKFAKLFEEYQDHPERERIIAREMGWTWVEEMLDAQESGELIPGEDDIFSCDIPDLVPNPLTEGVDWVRDDNGRIAHPLTIKMQHLGIEMWRCGEEKGYMEDGGDTDFQEMVSRTQITGAKLAGALNHLAYEDVPDGGFVVAALKRALNHLHGAIAAAARVGEKKDVDGRRVRKWRKSLFDIRQDILALMQRFRQQI